MFFFFFLFFLFFFFFFFIIIIIIVNYYHNNANMNELIGMERWSRLWSDWTWPTETAILTGTTVERDRNDLKPRAERLGTGKIVTLTFVGTVGFDITCKTSPEETNCMKLQILFSCKNKKENIISPASAELAQRVIKVQRPCGIETDRGLAY